jgi:hypothetical protein
MSAILAMSAVRPFYPVLTVTADMLDRRLGAKSTQQTASLLDNLGGLGEQRVR